MVTGFHIRKAAVQLPAQTLGLRQTNKREQ